MAWRRPQNLRKWFQPGAGNSSLNEAGDLSHVQVAYRGIRGTQHRREDGSLEIDTDFGKLHETQPRIYQQISGQRVAVKGRFKLTSETDPTLSRSEHIIRNTPWLSTPRCFIPLTSEALLVISSITTKR